MSESTDAEFDPRFDPAFQRGFDTSIPVTESVPEPVPHVLAQPEPVTPAPLPAVVPPPVKTAPVKESAPSPAPAAIDEDVVHPVPEDGAQLFAETAETRSARNPFLVVILAAAVVLIGFGLWLFIQSGTAFNSSQVLSQGDYQALMTANQVAPFIALLGLATAIGLLFVLAIGWRRRH